MPHPTLSPRFRPALVPLESRLVPAVVATPALSAPAPTINQKIVSYLEAHLGQRVGGGECAHLASEALRVAGAKFIRGADFPAAGDYVWGALVKAINAASGTARDSAPTRACRPGDVLQYHNTTFRNGMWASHHTAIVAAVDSRGWPTAVYEQNFNGVRTVARHSVDFSQMSAGYVRVYRGTPRVAVAGRTEFTITNNTAVARSGVLQVAGWNLGAFTLGAANTWSAYQSRYITATPGYIPTITFGTTTLPIVNGAGYEVFLLPSGYPSIRRIG